MKLNFFSKSKTSKSKPYQYKVPTYLDPKENGGFDKIDPDDCDGHPYVWVDWDSEPHYRHEVGINEGVCVKCGSRIINSMLMSSSVKIIHSVTNTILPLKIISLAQLKEESKQWVQD